MSTKSRTRSRARHYRRARRPEHYIGRDQVFPELIGESAKMREFRDSIWQCQINSPRVLIIGESGTGKELTARAIHASSNRSKGPFVSVNCSAVPESLFEAEFFGARKGAYTGLTYTKDGYCHQAHHGTLFLDEIGEMSPVTQAKLLRFLDDQKVRRLGSNLDEFVDVRVISATNKNLIAEIENGGFRKDLYHRVAAIEIHTPPLRERLEDIPLLVAYFVKKFETRSSAIHRISSGAVELLRRHNWPGNVRELQHITQQMLSLVTFDQPLTADIVRKVFQKRGIEIPTVKSKRLRRGEPIVLPKEVLKVRLDHGLRCIEKQAKWAVLETALASLGRAPAASDRLGVSHEVFNTSLSRLRARRKIELKRMAANRLDSESETELEYDIATGSFRGHYLLLPEEAATVREDETLDDFLARYRKLVIRAVFKKVRSINATASWLRMSPKAVNEALW